MPVGADARTASITRLVKGGDFMNWDFLKRTSFWIAVATVVGAWAAAAAGQLSPDWAVIMTAISSGAYALSRGLAKYDADLKAGWKTTEFWVAVVSLVVCVAAAVPGEVAAQVSGIATLIISALYLVSRGLAKNAAAETGQFDVIQ